MREKLALTISIGVAAVLAAVRAGTLTATASPLHIGRTVIVVETELRDETGRLAAKTTQTQAAMRT